MCKVFNTLHQNTLGSIYQISKKNTSCTYKVFNTLDLNTWGSIYPTWKQYLLYVQSIQYFAPKYLLGPFNQLRKITSCTCKIFNTLHLHTWRSIYPTSKNTSCTCKVFNTLHLNSWVSIYPTSKKILLAHAKYLHLITWGFISPTSKKILHARAKYSILCTYIPGGPYIQLQKILLASAKYSIFCT